MLSSNTLPYMDPTAGIPFRSSHSGNFYDDATRFSQDNRHFMTVPQESASSFTALLELPATQALDLLHMSELGKSPAAFLSSDDLDRQRIHSFGKLIFPSNTVLMDHAARFSVAAKEQIDYVSPESSSMPSNSCGNSQTVKTEPAETQSSQPLASDSTMNNQNKCQSQNQKNRSGKRKERDKKVNSSVKKSTRPEDDDRLPYVHVRARRGQATDSHSLAERARREKINARMKLLQELVPGCNKIQGTALVLDEIINHVQSLQRQVEVLSMRLAAVNPRNDFTLDPILSADSNSLLDSSISGTLAPLTWPEVTGNRQICQHLPQLPFEAFQNLML